MTVDISEYKIQSKKMTNSFKIYLKSHENGEKNKAIHDMQTMHNNSCIALLTNNLL
jgi:hypothetical protein